MAACKASSLHLNSFHIPSRVVVGQIMSSMSLSEPAKMLLLGSLLAKQRIISNNAKSFLKEMILRRDPRLARVLAQFEDKTANDAEFLENIHELIRTYLFPLK